MGQTRILDIGLGRTIERQPGETLRAFMGRAGTIRREEYFRWMRKWISSLADFELEANILAVRARKTMSPYWRFALASQLRWLREELGNRTTFGPDTFIPRRPEYVAQIAALAAAAAPSSPPAAPPASTPPPPKVGAGVVKRRAVSTKRDSSAA